MCHWGSAGVPGPSIRRRRARCSRTMLAALDELLNAVLAQVVESHLDGGADDVDFDHLGDGHEAHVLDAAAFAFAGTVDSILQAFEVVGQLAAYRVHSHLLYPRRSIRAKPPTINSTPISMCVWLIERGGFVKIPAVIQKVRMHAGDRRHHRGAAGHRARRSRFRPCSAMTSPWKWKSAPEKAGFCFAGPRPIPIGGFFGIEWANKICHYVADRMVRHGIPNVRLMRTDARHLVMLHQMPHGCVTILHIYHPDPWPKKRHHKRRLIQPSFLAAVVEVLVPGGRVAIQTDHAEYFEQIRDVARVELRLEEVPFDVPRGGRGRGPGADQLRDQVPARGSSHLPDGAAEAGVSGSRWVRGSDE